MRYTYTATDTGFVALVDGYRVCIVGGPSPIADQVDYRWTIEADDAEDDEQAFASGTGEVLASGETVTPRQADAQIAAWLDAYG